MRLRRFLKENFGLGFGVFLSFGGRKEERRGEERQGKGKGEMAGRAGIAERRLKPLWDAIDHRQYKPALKLATGLIAKHPDSAYLLVRVLLLFWSVLWFIFSQYGSSPPARAYITTQSSCTWEAGSLNCCRASLYGSTLSCSLCIGIPLYGPWIVLNRLVQTLNIEVLECHCDL